MRLRLSIYLLIANILPIVMISLDQFESWSKYAQSSNEILLDATLICLALIWYERREWVASFLFIGILLTDVTLPALAIPHYIFTGAAAILSAFIIGRFGRPQAISAGLGLGLFGIGFLTPLYSTAVGEWLFLVAGSINIAFKYVKR